MIDISDALKSFLQTEYDRCRDDELEDERTTAIDRYNGELYGDEEDGRSQVVARDTAETVDYMVISILRTIVSGDDVVEFDHENAELAHQATRTVKWLLMKKQDGYRTIHDWLKAGLLEKSAVAMAYIEPQPKKRLETTVSAMALMVAEQQGIEVIEAEETGEFDEQGAPMFKVAALQEQPPMFCVTAVPNEEFYCSPDARTLDEAVLKGRKVPKAISELVAEGVDKAELEALGHECDADSTLARARDEDRYTDMGARRGSARRIWLHEEYVTFDANDDGIAETLYVRRTSDFKVLSIEEVEPEDHPFEEWCPFPMQHRRIGQSLADKTMDLERINTVLMRQSLDGIYLSSNPVTYVHEDSIGENTIEDLLTVRPGAIRRYKGPHGPPTSQQDRFDPSAGFAMLEYMDRKRETRTGITRLNMGLDERTHTDTARGQDQLLDRGDQVEEYVSRNFASPLARLFTKLAKLLKAHGQPIKVPIDGEYVMVDPRQWPDDMIAEPKLGLGSTRKEKRVASRERIIGYQMAAVEAGMTDLVDSQKLFNSAKGIVNDSGLGDATEYFNDPSKPQLGPDGQPVPPKEPPPDPEMEKAKAEIAKGQAELQQKQAQFQADQQEAQARFQMEAQREQAKAELERAKAAAAAELARERAMAEVALARQRAAAEVELERERLAHERAMGAARIQTDRDVKMSKNREGGDLSK